MICLQITLQRSSNRRSGEIIIFIIIIIIIIPRIHDSGEL